MTFSAGAVQYRLPASLVREVLPLPAISRLPHAPGALLGLANVRGAVVPVASVARWQSTNAGTDHRLIVIDRGGLFGLAVSRVNDLVSGDAEASGELLDIEGLLSQTLPMRRTETGRSNAVQSGSAAETPAERIAILSFSISGQLFGFPVSSVAAVLAFPGHIDRTPHADTAVLGAVPFDDVVLPVLSLAALLGLQHTEPTRHSRIVAVRDRGRLIGLLIDRIEDVITADEDAIEPVPEILNRGDAEARIQAICKLDGGSRLLSVLAPSELLRGIAAEAVTLSADAMAPVAAKALVPQQSFVIIRTGQDRFALPAASVQQVLAAPDTLTRIAHAPGFVKGLMSAKGSAIPVIDLGRRFASAESHDTNRLALVLQVEGLAAAIIVDDVLGVARTDPSQIDAVPGYRDDEDDAVFDTALRLENKASPVPVINPARLLPRERRVLLNSLSARGGA